MTDQPDYYVNDPAGTMKAHIFPGEAVREAVGYDEEDGNGDEQTAEPVSSVCGIIRSYGPFEEWADDAQVCKNCTNNISDYDDD